jgi:hypothetical protein
MNAVRKAVLSEGEVVPPMAVQLLPQYRFLQSR